MLNLRPHRLSRLVVSGGYTDSDGFYHKGAERCEGDVPCHARPAGKANEIVYEDGTTKRYSYSVYLDRDKAYFSLGDRVRLYLGEAQVLELEVLGLFNYQTHCKLWL